MQFREVIGQQAIKKQLIQTVTENRVSHAQLFTGTEGTGALQMALAFAQYVQCENPGTDDACGVCASCHKNKNLVHPDVHFVFPVIKASSGSSVSDNFLPEWRQVIKEQPYFGYNQWMQRIGAANKQGAIFVDESSEILRKINLKTYEADYKVMIIWLPEKMRIETSNKLLKVLEEPPAKTLFMLVSEDPGLLLPTIVSRCQSTQFRPIEVNDIKNALQQQGVALAESTVLARRASGSMVKAQEAMQMTEEEKFFFDQFVAFMRISYALNISELMKWVDEMADAGRERQKNFCVYALRQVRENFILHFSMPEISYQAPHENDFSKKFYRFINERNIEGLSKTFSQAVSHIESNANAKILFFDLGIRLHRLLKMP
jgi:DNA polymerase III subunit delta'